MGAQRNVDVKKEITSHVKYVTQLIASLHDERRKLMISKDILTVWREHTWGSVRRRIGIYRLSQVFQKRNRTVFTRWVHTAAIQNLASCLHKQYSKSLQEHS